MKPDKEQEIALQIADWYESSLGKVISHQIQLHLHDLLTKVFGYFAIQLGCCEKREWLASCHVTNTIFVGASEQERMSSIATNFAALPFANASIDLVVLPHTLEYAENPQMILHEVDRVLVAGGTALIIGFNSFSLWGFARFIFRYKRKFPWNVNYFSNRKLRQMLREHGLSVAKQVNMIYRPPIQNKFCFNKLLILETLGELIRPYPSGFYILHATKQTQVITRIEPIWTYKNIVVGKRYVQPTTKILHR